MLSLVLMSVIPEEPQVQDQPGLQSKTLFYNFKGRTKQKEGAREMAQPLRALAVFAEDLDVGLSTHTVAQSYP